MTRTKRSFYGQARKVAYDLWKGPNYLEYLDDTNALGGLCFLRLAIRQKDSMNPQIEARAVYGSLVDEEQPDAIMRAVYWDSQVVIPNNHHDPSEAIPFKMPARFVCVPILLARQWISKFDGLQTFLQAFPLQNDSLPICSLKIEADPVYSGFEMIWQVVPGKQNEFTNTWQEVWLEMGKVLQTSPTVRHIEEFFPCVEGKPEVYDFQAYQPVLTLP